MKKYLFILCPFFGVKDKSDFTLVIERINFFLAAFVIIN